jgi:glutamate dehydrogenase/leucine dehydrogenase
MKKEQLEAMIQLKNEKRLPFSEFGRQFLQLDGFEFIWNQSVWEIEIPCDITLSCATQNEILP